MTIKDREFWAISALIGSLVLTCLVGLGLTVPL